VTAGRFIGKWLPTDPGEQDEGRVKRRGLPRASAVDQADMFSTQSVPTANVGPATRSADPETSRAAARRAGQNLTAKQTAVLALFVVKGWMTDEEVETAYNAIRRDIARFPETAAVVPEQSPSGLRTRRSELVQLKYLTKAGIKRPMATGGEGTVWKVRSDAGALPMRVVNLISFPK
jgi:hypothetical protein